MECFQKSRIMIGIITLVMGMLVIVGECRTPMLHEVGGDRFGWRLNVNFSDWAAHQIFYVGDWLYFGFDKTKINVLEVNQTGYENCIESNYMTNITKGGRDVFNLTVARPYYFISGRGYCDQGIKLAINVQDAPPDPLPPSSSSSSSSSSDDPDSLRKGRRRSPTTVTTTIITSHATSALFPPSDHFLIMIIILSGIYVTWSFLYI